MIRPKCSECGSGFVYIRRDNKIVCRRCGHIGEVEESGGS